MKKEPNIEMIVGQNSRIKGSIETKGSVRFDGFIDGDITSDGNIIIGRTGKVKGNLKANDILAEGLVEGNIKAKKKIEISQTGKVKGDIQTDMLKIEIGGVLEGNCNMQSGAKSEEKKI